MNRKLRKPTSFGGVTWCVATLLLILTAPTAAGDGPPQESCTPVLASPQVSPPEYALAGAIDDAFETSTRNSVNKLVGTMQAGTTSTCGSRSCSATNGTSCSGNSTVECTTDDGECGECRCTLWGVWLCTL